VDFFIVNENTTDTDNNVDANSKARFLLVNSIALGAAGLEWITSSVVAAGSNGAGSSLTANANGTFTLRLALPETRDFKFQDTYNYQGGDDGHGSLVMHQLDFLVVGKQFEVTSGTDFTAGVTSSYGSYCQYYD